MKKDIERWAKEAIGHIDYAIENCKSDLPATFDERSPFFRLGKAKACLRLILIEVEDE
jgi:hypothetical protein